MKERERKGEWGEDGQWGEGERDGGMALYCYAVYVKEAVILTKGGKVL